MTYNFNQWKCAKYLSEKYTKMYLKYINFVLSMLQIHLHIYVLNKNTMQLYFWHKLVYLKSAKLKQLLQQLFFTRVIKNEQYIYNNVCL